MRVDQLDISRRMPAHDELVMRCLRSTCVRHARALARWCAWLVNDVAAHRVPTVTVNRFQFAGERVTIQHLPPAKLAGPVWDRWCAHVLKREDGVAGVDVETTAIDDILGPFEPSAKLRMIQFGSRRYGWALDPADEVWAGRIYNLLTDQRFRFVSHTNYDPLWIRRQWAVRLGYENRSLDTMPMAALLFPGVTQRKDLKSLCDKFIDTKLSEAEKALTARFKELAPVGSRVGKTLKRWGFTNIPLDDEVFGLYGGLDAIAVRRLLDVLAAKLTAYPGAAGRKLAKLSRREQRIQRLSTDVRWRGQRVDAEWAADIMGEVEGEFNDADEFLRDTWGFATRSPKRGPWLAEHGAEFTEFTPTGAPKLTMPSASSDGTLPGLAERYADDAELGPIFAAMVTLGSHSNMLTNLRIIRAAGANDGFVHPEIVTQAAHTGRMSIKKPAMQTLKKRDPRLRGCFIARDGHVLVGADYPSQEIRIAAAFSRDPALLAIVKGDLNQHLETARMLFDVTDKTTVMNPISGKTFYDAAKTLDFAQQYGAGPARIGDQLGYPSRQHPEDERRRLAHPKALAMWRAWREAYDGLVTWGVELGDKKLIVNPWGRRIPADPWRGYASANYAIQSTGRDMLGDAIVALDDAGWGEHLWLFVHDEMILEVPEDDADDAVDALSEFMSTRIRDIDVPVVGEILGTRWGQAKE